MDPSSALFIGVKGHVVCIRKTDGVELWRKHLIGSDTTSVCVEDGKIFAGTRGRLFRLDIQNGEIEWINELPKLGLGMCLIGSPNQGAMSLLHLIEQQQIAAAAAAFAASSGAATASGAT